jgi:hypothetical protein
MANIASDNMAKITARLGVYRLATGRLACAPVRSQLDSDGTLKFHRPNTSDGDPIYSTATWSNERGEN